MEVFQRLRGYMIEIDDVTNGMYDGKEERRTSNDFVKWYMRIQWYVLLYGEIFEFRQ